MVVHHLSTNILCQSAYLKRRPDGRSSVVSLCNRPNNCISHLEIFVRFGRIVVPPLYLQEGYLLSNIVRVRVVLYVVVGATKMCQKFVYVTSIGSFSEIDKQYSDIVPGFWFWSVFLFMLLPHNLISYSDTLPVQRPK
jgi:hypothetical protein